MVLSCLSPFYFRRVELNFPKTGAILYFMPRKKENAKKNVHILVIVHEKKWKLKVKMQQKKVKAKSAKMKKLEEEFKVPAACFVGYHVLYRDVQYVPAF